MLLPCLSCAYFDYLVSGNYCFLSTAVRTSQVNNSLILKCYRTKLSTHVVVDVKFISIKTWSLFSKNLGSNVDQSRDRIQKKTSTRLKNTLQSEER